LSWRGGGKGGEKTNMGKREKGEGLLGWRKGSCGMESLMESCFDIQEKKRARRMGGKKNSAEIKKKKQIGGKGEKCNPYQVRQYTNMKGNRMVEEEKEERKKGTRSAKEKEGNLLNNRKKESAFT